MKKRCFPVYIATAILLLTSAFSAQRCSAGVSDNSKPRSGGGLVRISAASRADDPFDGISFPTIYKSGYDVCTNIGGQPVVFLFTSSTCPTCRWLGDIFDVIAKNYMDDGLIEVHRYDMQTKDDLYTEEVETEIPEEIFELYRHGSPKDLVPYINFSCKYERVGIGHKETKDADAEGREIMEVIETLIKVLSGK